MCSSIETMKSNMSLERLWISVECVFDSEEFVRVKFSNLDEYVKELLRHRNVSFMSSSLNSRIPRECFFRFRIMNPR